MALLLISIPRVLLFFMLIQSVSLYRIYALDDNHPNSLRHSLSSPIDETNNQVLPIKYLGYDNDDDDDISVNTNSDENNDNLPPWLSLVPETKQQSIWKRSKPLTRQSAKALPQRRNYRPHWNPLVAAYKRCGELSRPEERESCFKDAVQMLFVHKLRK
ncbi:unnamed protein product [Adineta steineri]|uniref:Uncharacterized protein n=1 Tax=Adineta steineri TaxID=433720 RepID=A0A818JWD5_9BILA|nr:unnamed protein product [Adineta steineri]CAF1397072.1 unnamed protein product [Adineta steineri]CAF1412630.1 unnamed protein product [Adineta steineri]CAF3545372.1 unnamed protein product [Adineta steineri]CAF3812378.1 unnamed protein product [Adineta steineri]